MFAKIALALAVTAGVSMTGIASAEARPDVVSYRGDYAPGTIVVKTKERRLYLIVDQDRAIRYPVGVGKAGMQWRGLSRIDGKYLRPAWVPPPEVKRDHPELPDFVPGGSPHNPMGVAALTLAGDQYAIHGTTQAMRKSVGTFASYGCIRMLNEDIADLYPRVGVGTPVMVVP